MLSNDFFYIRSLREDNGSIQAGLEINPAHHIFDGHFPGQPIVPGVCMVQMVKEILEQSIGKSLQLQKADHIKFLSFIIPAETPHIEVSITYSINDAEIPVVATLKKGETVCCKLKGSFVVIT